jgi:8-oxo-dGTP pyrophosphatase MutT (NUDIX family)
MGGVLVFPGGKVDEADHAPVWDRLATPLSDRARMFSPVYENARAFAVGALREALEEAAILPVTGGVLDAGGALAFRDRLSRGGSLPDLLDEQGLVLDAGRLEPLGRWITPEEEPKRFDARFYVVALPAGQVGLHDDRETTRSFWATASEVLARWDKGEVRLSPPTAWMLELFSNVPDVTTAFELAKKQSLAAVLPKFVHDSGHMLLVLPGDPLYPETSTEALALGSTTRFVFENGRFLPLRAAHSPSR